MLAEPETSLGLLDWHWWWI